MMTVAVAKGRSQKEGERKDGEGERKLYQEERGK